MRKTALLLVVGALVLAVAGGAASAQEEGGATGYPAGGKPPPPPPDYAFRKGEVYIDGDLVIGCHEFVEDFEGFYDERGDQAQAKRVLERCVEAGSPGLRIPAEIRGEIRRDTREGGLPETGGAPVTVLLAGLLLVAGAGLGALRGTGAGKGR